MVGLMINDLMSADPSAEGGDMRNIYKVGLNTTRLLMALGDVVCALAAAAPGRGRAGQAGRRGLRRGQGVLRGQGRRRAVLRAAPTCPGSRAERAIAEAIDLSLMDLDEAAF